MKDITDFINDRLASQFFGSYVVAFAIVHYCILMTVLFDTITISEKIDCIQEYAFAYNTEWLPNNPWIPWRQWYSWFPWVPIIPFLWSMIILLVYRTGNSLSMYMGKYYKVLNANVVERIEEGSTVDNEVVVSLRTRYEELRNKNSNLSDRVDKSEKELKVANDLVKEKIRDLSTAKAKSVKQDKTIDEIDQMEAKYELKIDQQRREIEGHELKIKNQDKIIEDYEREIDDRIESFKEYDSGVATTFTYLIKPINSSRAKLDPAIRDGLNKIIKNTDENILKSIAKKLINKVFD